MRGAWSRLTAWGRQPLFTPPDRDPYEDNDVLDSESGRTLSALGNEGFNLDPPRVDPKDGEMAAFDEQARTAIHERHTGKGTVLWADGHCSGETLKSLGYQVNEDGVVGFEGNNRKFSINLKDEAWVGY